MIYTTYETTDQICSKIEMIWFLFAYWVAKNSKTNGKKELSKAVFENDVLKIFSKITEKHL